VLIADFNHYFFSKQLEVLKLEQKANRIKTAEREDFIENLLLVDFNNRSEESKHK